VEESGSFLPDAEVGVAIGGGCTARQASGW
jgi:hypothetical protein